MASVRLDTGFGMIRGYRMDPPNRPRGGLVVVQEIFGVNPHIRAVVDRFAAHGYVTLAPAMFDLIQPDVQLGYDDPGIARGRELAAQVGFDRAVAAVEAASKALSGSVERIGVVGFCWGGTVAFLANTRLSLPAVSYYGGRTVPFLNECPKAPLMLHFGEHDPIIPPADVQVHRDVLEEAFIHVYDAGHGFSCDQRADYSEEAAQEARRRTVQFFTRFLQP